MHVPIKPYVHLVYTVLVLVVFLLVNLTLNNLVKTL